MIFVSPWFVTAYAAARVEPSVQNWDCVLFWDTASIGPRICFVHITKVISPLTPSARPLPENRPKLADNHSYPAENGELTRTLQLDAG